MGLDGGAKTLGGGVGLVGAAATAVVVATGEGWKVTLLPLA